MNIHQAPERLEVPEVSISTAGTVVVELTPTQAQVLARILAHYEVVTTDHPVADGYDPDIWQHTLIRLLAEAANARLEIHAPTAVLVPVQPTGARP